MTTTGSAGSSTSQFFAYHGMWAPGVRLFRTLRFRAKAALISLMFAVPLAVLAWSFYTAIGSQIEFSSKERLGVEYARLAAPLLQIAQADRTAPQPDAVGRASAAMTALADTQKRLGAELGTAPAHADLVRAHQAWAQARTQQTAQALMQAVLTLLTQAADGSNLTLDPDIDSYYLMDGALFRLPDLIDQSAQLRDLSAESIEAGAVGEARTLRMGGLGAILEYMDGNLAGGLAKSTAVRPNLTVPLAAEPVRQQLAELRRQSQAVLARSATRPSSAAVRRDGDATVAALGALQLRMLDQLDVLLAERVSGLQRQRSVVTALLLVFLPAAAYLFASFYRVMHGGLAEVQRHLRAMSSGDLSLSPSPWGRDEAASLMLELRTMQNALRGIVTAVRESSDSIVAASRQIASGSQNLSERTEAVSAKVQQSAAAMEQITATSQSTAGHAANGGELAAENETSATASGEVMARMIETMKRIEEASSRIGAIIGVIDGIAFQTNILALNAAVEAARAGESGRGFSVVAAEVRALAGRAAQAAAEIKQLVTASGDQVHDGTRIVGKAGEVIATVVETSRRVRGLLDAIAEGSREQSQGVTQMSTMMTEVDDSTQQNAALVEQTAAAAASLAQTAHALADHVAVFKLPQRVA